MCALLILAVICSQEVIGSCADGTWPSQEAALAKANPRNLKWMYSRPKSPGK